MMSGEFLVFHRVAFCDQYIPEVSVCNKGRRIKVVLKLSDIGIEATRQFANCRDALLTANT